MTETKTVPEEAYVMQNRIHRYLPLGLAAQFVLLGTSLGADERFGITWHNSYAAARQLARETGKPLLVEFR